MVRVRETGGQRGKTPVSLSGSGSFRFEPGDLGVGIVTQVEGSSPV